MIFEHLERIRILTDFFHEYWKALGEDRCEYCTKKITKRQKHFQIKFPDVTIQWHDKCARKYNKEHPPIMRTPILYKKGDIVDV